MAKKTKITAVTIAKAMELVDFSPVTIKCGNGDNAIEIPVKPRLTLSERATMVSDIVNMLFIGIDDDVRYCPAFKKFAIEFNIVTHFTDVHMPIDSDKAYNFLERSDLAHRIIQELPDGYVDDIISDAMEAIEYRKQELLKKSKLDEILDSVLGVAHAIRDKTQNIEIPQIMEYIEKYMPEFKGQIEQLISAQADTGVATSA